VPPSSCGGAREDGIRAELQDQEKYPIQLISTVRLSLNELAPISTLPSELLERIFDSCVCWIYWFRKPDHCLAWTQVCTRWRRVALDSPRLWRYIDISHSHFAAEFLVRSRSAPICIVSHSAERFFIDSFHPHRGRLRSIDVILRFNDMQEFLSSVGPELPNLTSLYLALLPCSRNILYDVRIPSVRQLALDGVAVPWDFCSDLTHLSLRRLGEGFSPSVYQLGSILERSPQLECLQVENIFAAVSDRVPDFIVALPRLHKLTLFSQPPQFISYLLAGISIPSSAKLQLTCPSFDQISASIPRCTEHIQNLDTSTDVTILRLRRWSVQLLRQTSSPWSEDLSDTSLSITFLSPLPTPLFHSLRHSFDLSRLTGVELDAGVLGDVSMSTMEDLFAAMPCITTLRVALTELGMLLALLGKPVSSAPGGMLCPSLNRLSFSRPGDVWWAFAECWLQSVQTCVQDRMQHVPIRVLEFIRCQGISVQTVEPLAKFVENIIILDSFE